MWAIENKIGNFKVYYEGAPWSRVGYELLTTDSQRAAYDEVWSKHFFAGAMLLPFSPYLHLPGPPYRIPQLPYDLSKIESGGYFVPNDVKEATGYRELLALLGGLRPRRA